MLKVYGDNSVRYVLNYKGYEKILIIAQLNDRFEAELLKQGIEEIILVDFIEKAFLSENLAEKINNFNYYTRRNVLSNIRKTLKEFDGRSGNKKNSEA